MIRASLQHLELTAIPRFARAYAEAAQVIEYLRCPQNMDAELGNTQVPVRRAIGMAPNNESGWMNLALARPGTRRPATFAG